MADFLSNLNNNDSEYEKYLKYKTKGGVKNKILLDLMSKRKWGIDNDRIRGSYIDHFECLVCERLHENLDRKKQGKPLIKNQANKNHYGCPQPYTFSEDGILLDDKYENSFKWKPSSFLTSFELAYINQKLFFDKYLSNNIYNFTHKSLQQETFKYHREVFKRKNENIDLRK